MKILLNDLKKIILEEVQNISTNSKDNSSQKIRKATPEFLNSLINEELEKINKNNTTIKESKKQIRKATPEFLNKLIKEELEKF